VKKTVKKITVDIGAVIPPQKEGSKYRIHAKRDSGRTLYFHSARKDLRAGQRVTLTYHILKADGELVGARFSSWENVKIEKAEIKKRPGRPPKSPPKDSLIKDITQTLINFKSRMHRKSGHVYVEGIKVELEQRGWFKIYLDEEKFIHAVWPRDAAKILAGKIEAESE